MVRGSEGGSRGRRRMCIGGAPLPKPRRGWATDLGLGRWRGEPVDASAFVFEWGTEDQRLSILKETPAPAR